MQADKSFVTFGNWQVQSDLSILFRFVLPMFERIFGQSIMSKEACTVFSDLDCPTAPVTAFNPTRIILKAEPSYWSQVVYQLSHELTHYAVRQKTNYQYSNCAIAAFEEPACEAMALYIEKLCSENWSNCEYSSWDSNWGANFEVYRKAVYEKVSGEAHCRTYHEWINLCSAYTGSLTVDAQRPDVSAMRNHLYDSFVQMPYAIAAFIEYPLYMRTIPFEMLIDTENWSKTDYSSKPFIQAVCSIQPDIA
jgi:hypothetical protein